MAQAGRRSAAALAVVTSIPGQRPSAPKGLSKAEAAVWRSVVASKPADWFTPDTYPLLTQYCRHTATVDLIADRLALLTGLYGNILDAPDHSGLLDRRESETRAIISLARQMRLTQQSQVRADAAGAAKRRPGADRKPWE